MRRIGPFKTRPKSREKETFLTLLRDLCANVPGPEQTRGRPRLPLRDMIFAAAFKVYSTSGARRFMTDLRDAQSKGLIAQAPHYNSLFRCLESESVTPIIQDLIVRAALRSGALKPISRLTRLALPARSLSDSGSRKSMARTRCAGSTIG